MPSDFEIRNSTSSPASYCCGGLVVFIGITLIVLGILMLAKVKVLPERIFRENVKLETGVKWGSLALGIILGLCGIGMLQSESTASKKSNGASKSNSESKGKGPERSKEVKQKNHILGTALSEAQVLKTEVTPENINNLFIIKQEVVTEWLNFNYNAEICEGGKNNEYILSIHYKNKNDKSCIHKTLFTTEDGGFTVSYKTHLGGDYWLTSSKDTYGSFNSFITVITRQIKDIKEPLQFLVFQGPNGLVKKFLAINFD